MGLSVLALALATRFNEQTCATPLFQDSQVGAGTCPPNLRFLAQADMRRQLQSSCYRSHA